MKTQSNKLLAARSLVEGEDKYDRLTYFIYLVIKENSNITIRNLTNWMWSTYGIEHAATQHVIGALTTKDLHYAVVRFNNTKTYELSNLSIAKAQVLSQEVLAWLEKAESEYSELRTLLPTKVFTRSNNANIRPEG